MANWKIRMRGIDQYTSWYGTGWNTQTDDDLDLVASALGVSKNDCFRIITNIRVKKMVVAAGDAIDSIQFTYLVETKDKTIEVEGKRHGGIGGNKVTWDFSNYFMLKLKGCSGESRTSIRQIEVVGAYPVNGDTWTWVAGNPTNNKFDMTTVPTIFYSRFSNQGTGMLGDIGTYKGELYDADVERLQNDKTQLEKELIQLGGLKMSFLLQKNQVIQQLKRETKDKVLVTASKTELLAKWKEYPKSILLYQSQHKGDYCVLFIDKERPKAGSYICVNNLEWQAKDRQEITDFLKSINLKVGFSYWRTSNPNDDITITGFLSIGAIETLLSKIKGGEKYNLGDDIKDQGENNNYFYDWDWPLAKRQEQQNQLKQIFDKITTEEIVNELNGLKGIYHKLVDEWNEEFFEEFDSKLLSVDSLKLVRQKLDQLKKEIEQLKADKGQLQVEKNQLEQDKVNLNNQLSAKDKDISELNTKLTNKDNELTTANNSINTLTSEKNNLDTKLKEKDAEIANLKQQLAQQISYLEELKNQIGEKTEAFYLNNKLRLDESSDIRPKYAAELAKLVRTPEKINEEGYLALLDTLNMYSKYQEVIDAFKIVSLICATEKVQKMSSKCVNEETGEWKLTNISPIIKKSNLSYFRTVREFWELNKNLKPEQVNNPLWLPIIKEKELYRNKLDNILNLWEGKTVRQSKVIERSIFPLEWTVFSVIGDKEHDTERKDRVKKFTDQIKISFPSTIASGKMEKLLKKYAKTWDDLDNGKSTRSNFLTYFNYFNLEDDLIEPVNKDALEAAKKLFESKDSDNEVVKLLKEIANEREASVKSSFEDFPAGVIRVLFILDNFKNFYLDYLPKYITDELNRAKSIKLEEIKEKIKPVIVELFDNLHSVLEVVEESDLTEFKKNTNYSLEKLKQLISGESNVSDKIEKWIKDNISSKTKLEDLPPSEESIDNNVVFSNEEWAKKWAKLELKEKIAELTPASTVEERIKQLLTGVNYNWEKWFYLLEQKDKISPKSTSYNMAWMFGEKNDSFGKTVAGEMLPEINTAIAKNTMEDYRELDKKWDKNKLGYDSNRDRFGVWKNLQKLLKEAEISKENSNYEKLRNNTIQHIGEDRFKEIELEARIEVSVKKN